MRISISVATMTLLLALNAGLITATFGNPNQPLLLAGMNLSLILAALAVERWLPMTPAWNKSQDDTLGDVTSFAIIAGLDDVLGQTTPFVLLWLLPLQVGGLPLPFAGEMALAFFVVELGAWASHYAHHRFAPLWALHATHHAGTRLYTLNNTRFHPINHILNHFAMVIPAWAMGLSSDAIAAALAIAAPIVLLQHSNIAFRFGPLNGVLNTIEVHRWHHSAKPCEGNSNYGRATVIWDRLFGTYFAPNVSAGPAHLGLFAQDSSFPPASAYLRQLIWPFGKFCCFARR
jgi:sterol desaturase/sphingolipid hydroxylase (fatty acid hydroxylase superfamily)